MTTYGIILTLSLDSERACIHISFTTVCIHISLGTIQSLLLPVQSVSIVCRVIQYAINALGYQVVIIIIMIIIIIIIMIIIIKHLRRKLGQSPKSAVTPQVGIRRSGYSRFHGAPLSKALSPICEERWSLYEKLHGRAKKSHRGGHRKSCVARGSK